MIIGTIALLSLLLFGGAGGLDLLNELQEQSRNVHEVVADGPRAQDAQRALEAMVSEFEALAAEVEAERENVITLDLRYDVTEAEYRESLDGLLTAWATREHRVRELRSDLREATTREEWDALNKDLRQKVEEMTTERAGSAPD